MRLGFYYHIPAITENEKILMPGYLGRFIDSLASNFDQLVLFMHLPDPGETTHFDYEISSGNVKFIPLVKRGSVPNRTLFPRKFTGEIRTHIDQIDGMLIRGPTPLLPVIARAVRKIPCAFLIIGDYVAGIDSLPQPYWRKELIRLWAKLNAYQQYQVIRNQLIFVNSNILYKKYYGKVTNLREMRTSTYFNRDIFVRKDTCLESRVRLLYTGRLDPAKGLLDMINAISILIKKGEDIVFSVVGWPEENSNIIERMQLLAKDCGIKDRIFFEGYKTVGDELFRFYIESDIYIIASQTSEGFPRTIWEAMAHCLPVVATKVGSIPDFINGAAELVDPKSPQGLADGISNIIHDPVKRRTYISKGLELAQQNTLESQVSVMAGRIKEWIKVGYE